MNFDITWCKGEGCSKKDTCHRYFSSEVAKIAEDQGERYLSFITPTRTNPDGCSMYWEEVSKNELPEKA